MQRGFFRLKRSNTDVQNLRIWEGYSLVFWFSFESGEHMQALITGAADGIGRALALRCAQAGYAILGVDVDGERSAQTQAEITAQGKEARFIQANLADAEEVAGLVEKLAEEPPVDLLIHNAGINAVGSFGALPLAQQ